MTPKLYAQPYDISATGFYFEKVEQYEELLGTWMRSIIVL